jgi:hypothetical protein
MTYAHNSKVEGIRFQGAPACTNMVRKDGYLTNCGEDGTIQEDGSVRCPECLKTLKGK